MNNPENTRGADREDPDSLENLREEVEVAGTFLRDIAVFQQFSQFSASRLRLSELGDKVLEKLHELFDYAAAGVLLYNHDSDTFRAISSHGEAEDWLGVCDWMNEQRLAEEWLHPEREASVIQPTADLQCQLSNRRESGSLVVAPLLVEDRLIGALAFWFSPGASLSQRQQILLVSLAGQVALVLRNAELYRYSQELAVTEERRRIAREIHDGVAQNMAHLMLKADLVQKLMTRDLQRAKEEARLLRAGIEASVQELRRCIYSLRPVHLAELGLSLALRRVAEDIAEQGDLELDLQIPPEVRLGSGTEAAVFRIVQEALNNVRKHAHAERVQIALREEGDLLLVSVTDDGVGFDGQLVEGERTGHYGLAQMRERAREVGGDLRVNSTPGRGTVVEVLIPRSRNAARRLAAGRSHT